MPFPVFPFISQLAYCVVQFLEKDSTLTEPVRFIYFDIDFLAFFYFLLSIDLQALFRHTSFKLLKTVFSVCFMVGKVGANINALTSPHKPAGRCFGFCVLALRP